MKYRWNKNHNKGYKDSFLLNTKLYASHFFFPKVVTKRLVSSHKP